MCKFSIIVPVYNVENELSKCIDSILGQSVEDFELILIDDGSTDRSGEICDDYGKKDRRIKVIHKSNGGVSSARNSGLDIANGEYIVFVDSDDYVTEDYLEKLYNPNVDMVLCNIKYININLGKFYTLKSRKYGRFYVKDKIIDELINSRYISTVYSKSYKRNILESNKIRFDTSISLGEDTMFVVDYIVCINEIYISNSLIYNYIDYGTESLSKFSMDKFKMLKNSGEYIEKILKERNLIIDEIYLKKYIWKNYEWAIFEIIKSRDINLIKKIRSLNDILNNEKYRIMLDRIDIYMEEDTCKVKKILCSKSSIKILIFFKLLKLKKILEHNTTLYYI